MRKLIISLLTLVSAAGASAQNFIGSWELFPSYSSPNKVIETPEYVYTLTGASLSNNIPAGGSLSYYDKNTGEVGAMNSVNRLNANKVYNIWYSPEDKCLLVLFDDYNIDLVYDDGRTISVPDLRDAAVSDNKMVNDVAFANGKAFVGMKSGMITIDLAHGAITESSLWGKNISHIAASDKKIVLFVFGSGMYIGDQTGSHHNFDKSFTSFGSFSISATNLMRLTGDKILATNINSAFIINIKNDEKDNSKAYWRTQVTGHKGETATSIVPTRTGALTYNGSRLSFVNADGTFSEVTVSAANGNKVADWDGDGKDLWLADATGFGKYDSNAKQFAIARVKPKGTSGSNVGRIIQHPMTDEFYISTAEVHQNHTVYNMSFGKATHVDIYNATTKNFTAIDNTLMKSTLRAFGINKYNPDVIFTGHHQSFGRIINIKDKKITEITESNAGFTGLGSILSFYVDNHGNLWTYANPDNMEISKALKGSWENAINSNDWSTLICPELATHHSSRFVVDEDKRVIILTAKNGISGIQMPDDDEKLTSSCKKVFLDNSIDSDGSSLGGWKYPTLAIDKNGWVWIGNDVGVMYIKDSREMFNPGFAVTRPKVARNDGTNLADYLLNQVEVMCIAVDENNHKWIGTMGSGLYHVNEDGTEILEHLTTENSDIPSNDILAVCPDRNSNDVYVGTADGLSIYHSTTSPAADDYDNVYAYPNPVTPDFTGFITITGLKANSLVKITDASGNVFYETKSNGGMALWNGCDATGRRVRSGIYFVFASQSGENGTGAAVTKIVVVN